MFLMKLNSPKQKIGKNAENAVKKHLKKKGFHVLHENYAIHNTGEIDLIAKKDGILHFIEVKSLKIRNENNIDIKDIIKKSYNPAENLHTKKYKRIYTTAKIYIEKEKVSYETMQIDLYIVYYDETQNTFYIKKIENVIFSSL